MSDQPADLPDPSIGDLNDLRLELILSESRRALERQAVAVDELRSRASSLLTAASIVSAFLGGLALDTDNRGDLSLPAVLAVVAAIAAFLAVVTTSVYVLWPRVWSFVESASSLLARYVDREDGFNIDRMRWSMATNFERWYDENECKRTKLTRAIRTAALAVGWKS